MGNYAILKVKTDCLKLDDNSIHFLKSIISSAHYSTRSYNNIIEYSFIDIYISMKDGVDYYRQFLNYLEPFIIKNSDEFIGFLETDYNKDDIFICETKFHMNKLGRSFFHKGSPKDDEDIFLKSTSISYCQVCNKIFENDEIVYYAPIDNNIICKKCSELHNEIQPRIYCATKVDSIFKF